MRVVDYRPGDVESLVFEIVGAQPDFIEVTTDSTSGDEVKIGHGLGRIPVGYTVVKKAYAAPFTFDILHHGVGDSDWTDEFIYLKFSTTDESVTIAVY